MGQQHDRRRQGPCRQGVPAVSRDERCATCEWWQAGAPARATWESLPGHPEMFLGVCTYYPPVLVGTEAQTATALFPRTHQNRRCGSWTERDEATGDERTPAGFVVEAAERRSA